MSRWTLALCLVACRDPASAPVDDTSAPVAPVVSAHPGHVDAGGLEPKLPLDPACDGPILALFEAARDPRCAVSVSEWSELREAPGLAQEARREDQRVVFSIVNRGAAPILVPLRLDDRAPERVFTAVAQVEGDAAGLFALAPPAPDLRPNDSGVHMYNARIRLPPGGRASARLAIDLRVVERLDRRCAVDAGPLRGPIVLHIGQAFSPLDAGAPARVSWEALRSGG